MYDLHNAFSRTHVQSPSPWLSEGVASSVPSTHVAPPATRTGCDNVATPVPALLVVDGGHLHQALHEVVGGLAEDKDRTGLVSGLLDEMERALGVRFIKKVLHEATLGAQPTPLASALSSLASPFLVKTRPLKVKAGAPIDPDTLEPLPDGGPGPLAMLVEAGIDVAMALDVLRHASLGRDKSPYGAIVVATGNGDLGEVLDLASHSTTVYVCGMRNSTAHLQHLVPRGVSLDGLLVAALDLYCARRRDHPVSGEKLKRVCSLGARCTNLHNPSHRMSHVHPCPHRSACEYLRPSPVQEEEGEVEAARLEHLMHFSHPCVHAEHCSNSLQHHRVMWSHPASGEADHKQAATEGVRTQEPEDPASPASPHLLADPFGAPDLAGGYSSMPVPSRYATAPHHNHSSSRSSSSLARPRPSKDTQLSGVRFNCHHEEAAGEEDKGRYLDSRWGGRARAGRQSRCIPHAVLHPALLAARHGVEDWEKEEAAALQEEEQDDLLDVFRFAFHGVTRHQRESSEGNGEWSEEEEADDGDEQEHGDSDAGLPDPGCMFSMSL